MIKRITVEGMEEYPTYSVPDTYTCVKISELPHDMQERLRKFMHGQTRPVVEGGTDYVYLHDFANFLADGKLFWD